MTAAETIAVIRRPDPERSAFPALRPMSTSTQCHEAEARMMPVRSATASDAVPALSSPPETTTETK